ncbi:MAG: Xaa-Pro peptidase family protein [Planctomycetota bacterium]
MGSRNGKEPSPLVVDRLRRCRQEMKRKKIAAFLISNQPDYFYLTGFTGEDSALLLTQKDVHILSDGRFDEAMNQECPWVTRWMRKGSLNAEIAKACTELRLRSVFVQPEVVTLGEQADLRKLAKKTRFSSAPPVVGKLRRIKDETELAIMRKAIRIAEDAFLSVRSRIRVGQTELELAALLEYEMKMRGASAASFATICAEGVNAALPHAHAGNRKIKKGSAILFDWGARVGGYCSDLTRVVFVGSIPPRIGQVYRVVLDAQEKAIRAIKPGRKMCDVDAVAREAIKAAGFGEQFNHGLGHGLGLDVHEPPSLSWRSTEPLEAGMLVTVEPGVYLPGVGGVRIEDDVLVTPTGCRVLSNLPKRLDDMVI